PDFSFLKKMHALQKLTMIRIFYSYTDEFMQKDLNKIKMAPRYSRELDPIEAPFIENKAGVDESANVIGENKAIGEFISPIIVDVDSKIYTDLGLCKIAPKKNTLHKIFINFLVPLNITNIKLIKIEFLLNNQQDCLDITTQRLYESDDSLLNYIQDVTFPFLHLSTIKKIQYMNWFSEARKNSVIDIFSSQIFKYAECNAVEKIEITSPHSPLAMDPYRIIMFNNCMPDLKEICTCNVYFTTSIVTPKNKNEEAVLQTYAALVQSTQRSHIFKYNFVKNGNDLVIAHQ
ncbi:hypothetical protein NEPAR04_2542, partial [Nematocida parisii]